MNGVYVITNIQQCCKFFVMQLYFFWIFGCFQKKVKYFNIIFWMVRNEEFVRTELTLSGDLNVSTEFLSDSVDFSFFWLIFVCFLLVCCFVLPLFWHRLSFVCLSSSRKGKEMSLSKKERFSNYIVKLNWKKNKLFERIWFNCWFLLTKWVQILDISRHAKFCTTFFRIFEFLIFLLF